MTIIAEYLNPFNHGFQLASEAFHELANWQKVAAVISAMAGGILTPFLFFTGAFAAYRLTTEQFTTNNIQRKNIY